MKLKFNMRQNRRKKIKNETMKQLNIIIIKGRKKMNEETRRKIYKNM